MPMPHAHKYKTSKILRHFGVLVCLMLMQGAGESYGRDYVILQSTTSTQNSGLYEYLLPLIERDTGLRVHVVAVGTGQALTNARRCDGDVLITHARPAEEAFVANGFGRYRRDLMYNDYVVVGPRSDPANITGQADIISVMAEIAKHSQYFISRGDDSGTHKAEQNLWRLAGIDIDPSAASFYRETGSGMGPTLTVAVELNGYTLTDRSTWIFFANKQNHAILFEGDKRLFNQYGIIPIHPDHCPHNKIDEATHLTQWFLSPMGQAAIADYRQNGKQLFFPNASQITTTP
ncbi:MAG: substrate-binding domain-containing protein [Proteobacteria bacterium]|nr:substrate-binding domain-containing protein [Pseudomonadota bacterium]